MTVGELLEMPRLSLTLVAGRAGVERAIRWAHVSELRDPTPWLSGGELLLTTGMGLDEGIEGQRAYLERLIDANLAGLGFGVGFAFDSVPPGLVETAEQRAFPLVEVPYPVPFIAITEAVSSRLAEDRLRDAQMSVEVHQRLSSMLSAGSDAQKIVDEVVQLAPGWAMLFDLRGQVVAGATHPSAEAPAPSEVWAGVPPGLATRREPATAGQTSPRGTSVALAVGAGEGAHAEAVFVYGKGARLEQRDRIVVHHAVTVLGLLLASRRAVIETERRIAGDVLSEAFAGRLQGDELVRRLELVGFPENAADLGVLVVDPIGSEMSSDEIAWCLDAAVGARAKSARVGVAKERVAALVEHPELEELGREVARELDRDLSVNGAAARVRIGVG